MNDPSLLDVWVARSDGELQIDIRRWENHEILPSFLHPYILIAVVNWHYSRLSAQEKQPIVFEGKEKRVFLDCKYAAKLLSVRNAQDFAAALAERPEHLAFPAPPPPPADAKGARRFFC